MQTQAQMCLRINAPDKRTAAAAMQTQVARLVSAAHFATISVSRFEDLGAGEFEASISGPVSALGALSLALTDHGQDEAAPTLN